MILHIGDPRLTRTVCAAEELLPGLDSMPDDLASTMIADGRKTMNRALEAVERMTFSGGDYLESQMIVVASKQDPGSRARTG